MVNNISYNDYLSELKLGQLRIETNEQPLYYLRRYALNEINQREFEDKFKRSLLSPERSAEDRLILQSFFKAYNEQKVNTRQYGSIFEAISYDELAYLELGCTATYAKSRQYVFDFSDCVDLLFAFMTGVEIGEIRENIDRVCKEYGIGYKLFSRAWTTCELSLQSKIKIEMLYDIHPQLKSICKQILHKRGSVGEFNCLRSVNVTSLTDLDLIQMVIQSQLLLDLQYMQYVILRTYGASKRLNSDTLITSKGISTLLLTSQTVGKEMYYDINLGSAGNVRVFPKEYAKGEYAEALLTDTCYEIIR